MPSNCARGARMKMAMNPLMLLRARPAPAIRTEFEPWFRTVHMKDVSRIPGIIEARSARTAAGTHLGFFTFESAEVVQSAMASVEAAAARSAWERWGNNLEELHVEIFAPLFSLPMYRTVN